MPRFILRPLAGEIADTAGASVSAGKSACRLRRFWSEGRHLRGCKPGDDPRVVGLTVFKPGLVEVKRNQVESSHDGTSSLGCNALLLLELSGDGGFAGQRRFTVSRSALLALILVA